MIGLCAVVLLLLSWIYLIAPNLDEWKQTFRNYQQARARRREAEKAARINRLKLKSKQDHAKNEAERANHRNSSEQSDLFHSPAVSSDKYPALALIATLYRILAIICALLSILGILAGLIIMVFSLIQENAKQSSGFYDARYGVYLAISSAVWGGITTITFLAISEGIRIMIDIEHNLRQIRDRLPASNARSK